MLFIVRQQESAPKMPLHAPYPPQNAALGGVPTNKLDTPITAVFLFLFILGAIAHMTIFQRNMRKGHKFIMSGMTFGFCMARITTCVMRIVWTERPTHIPIAIAAQVFVAAGVVLLFVVNAIFAQRIVRAAHPRSGWHPLFSHAFNLVYILIVITLIMIIIASVQSFYTLNKNTKRIDRDIQLYGQTFYTLVAFLPFPLVIGGLLIPRKTRVEKFGNGRFRTKIYILLFSSGLLTLGAAFRAGTNYRTPRPRDDPAWYHSKACFYLFNLTIEFIVVLLYVVVRVDRRFYVPDGSRRAGDYSGLNRMSEAVTGDGGEKITRIMTEGEVFDDAPEEVVSGKGHVGLDAEKSV